uniref:Uncharacterized protein n=1 Tax=Helianthus annuus TaxID=4232 RepID=A0A251S5Y1_HELAN
MMTSYDDRRWSDRRTAVVADDGRERRRRHHQAVVKLSQHGQPESTRLTQSTQPVNLVKLSDVSTRKKWRSTSETPPGSGGGCVKPVLLFFFFCVAPCSIESQVAGLVNLVKDSQRDSVRVNSGQQISSGQRSKLVNSVNGSVKLSQHGQPESTRLTQSTQPVNLGETV